MDNVSNNGDAIWTRHSSAICYKASITQFGPIAGTAVGNSEHLLEENVLRTPWLPLNIQQINGFVCLAFDAVASKHGIILRRKGV